MNSTMQETNSQVVRAVGCHYSSRRQAIYTKGHYAVSTYTKTHAQTNRQEPIGCMSLLMSFHWI